MPSMIRLTGLAFAFVPAVLQAQALDFSRYRIVDLTHPFNAQTIYWPNSPTTFKLDKLQYGMTPGGYFYSSYAFSSPEHGGTHLDAPIHFSEKGNTAERIPLTQLMGPAVVIDVSRKANANRDYRLSVDDVRQFERANGTIKPGTIVLLRTGWSTRYSSKKAYLGDDTPGVTTNLHFPSFGAEATRLLVNDRKIGAVGIDAASIDYGPSTDFMVHRIVYGANIPGFENLTNLDQLPATGATLIALPMKIEGGSGAPLRAIALIPK
jgi:kynurenine formamidase